MKQIILKSNRIILRTPKESDAKELAKQINSPDIVRWTARIPYPYKFKDAVDFIKKQKKKIKKEEDFVFFIIDQVTSKIIGAIGLHHIEKKSKKSELGYWLIKEKWGQGIVSEATGLVLKFGFKDLRLHRIYAFCFESNIGSRKVLEKNGFTREGKVRESEFRFGKWHSLLQYSILEKEYKK
jgi:RimJ/RimL family protein N-acetyltransferase